MITDKPERARKRGELRHKCHDLFRAKTVVLCVVIAIVWMVLLVPTLIYTFRPEYTSDECDGLRDECDGLCDDCNSSGSGGSSNFKENSSLVCSEGFYISLEDISNGTTVEVCRPECGEWEEFPHSTVVVIYVTELVTEVVFVLSGAVVLVLSVIQYERMFKIPSVFIIYGLLCLSMIEFFDIIGKIDQKSLLCSSQDLMKSLDNSTVFCTVSGVVYCYILLEVSLFWLFHISFICWGVKFPFHYNNIKQRGYFKYIHIGVVLTALLLPWVAVGITFSTGGFKIADYPPTSFCLARDLDVLIYIMVLPFSILMAGGISLTAVILQALVLQKHRGNPPSSSSKGRKHLAFSLSQFNTPELKVLGIFIYYFAATGLIVMALSLLTTIGPEFTEDLDRYFHCEATGAKDCSKPQDRLGGILLRTISRYLVGLYPLVNLIYVVNVKELKQSFSRCKSQQRVVS